MPLIFGRTDLGCPALQLYLLNRLKGTAIYKDRLAGLRAADSSAVSHGVFGPCSSHDDQFGHPSSKSFRFAPRTGTDNLGNCEQGVKPLRLGGYCRLLIHKPTPIGLNNLFLWQVMNQESRVDINYNIMIYSIFHTRFPTHVQIKRIWYSSH